MKNRASKAGGVTFDQIFRAIGDPHRLQILLLLHEKELSAGEILKALDVVQSTLSHHMKSLVDAGVVIASRHGKWTYYSLNTEVLKETVSYLDQFTDGTKVRAELTRNTAAVLAAPALTAGSSEPSEAPVSSEEQSERKDEKKKSKKSKKGKKNKK